MKFLIAISIVMVAFLAACGGENKEERDLETWRAEFPPTITSTPSPVNECLIPDPHDEIVAGKKLVADQGRIYLQDFSEKSVIKLTDPGFKSTDRNPVWLPSKDGILFIRDNGFYVLKLGESTPTAIRDKQTEEISGISSFSPDGKKILFLTEGYESFDSRHITGRQYINIVTMDIDGNNPRLVITESYDFHDPYSHLRVESLGWKDNNTICYERNVVSGTGATSYYSQPPQKYQINLDGSGKQVVR